MSIRPAHPPLVSRARGTCAFWIDSLEPRQLLSDSPQGLAAVYTFAQTNFQSLLVDLSFDPAGPPTLDGGQTLTVQTSSQDPIGLFCSDAEHEVSVDGTPATGASSTSPLTYDYANGSIEADTGMSVQLAAGMHTVVFTVIPTLLSESITTTDDGSTPTFTGPWVVANGVTSGVFSSTLPFAIASTNHLAFVQQPTPAAVNAAIAPPITVAVEDSNNNIIPSDNDSVITIAPNDNAGIDPTVINGTVTAAMVNGVATFSGISLQFSGSYTLYAAAGGFAQPTGPDGPAGNLEPVGMYTTSTPFSIGGGGGGSSALTVSVLKSTLPASVVAGGTSHGEVVLSVENSGSSDENSNANVDIFASTDGTVDNTAVSIAQVSRHLVLKPARSTDITVPIRSLPASLDGSYTLIAQVTDAFGNSATSTTGPALTAAAPFIAFSETILNTTLPQADVSGQKTRASIQLRVLNRGNITSTGASSVALYASSDQSAANGTLIRSASESIVLKPGASRTIPLPLLAIPAVSNGPYFIVAQVTDPKSDLTSTATATTFTLAPPFIAFQFGSATTIIADHGKGAATVFFSLTNSGNITSSGSSTVKLFTGSGGIAAGSAVFTRSVALQVQPGKTRTFHLVIPSAASAVLSADSQVLLQVIDPMGNVQTTVLLF